MWKRVVFLGLIFLYIHTYNNLSIFAKKIINTPSLNNVNIEEVNSDFATLVDNTVIKSKQDIAINNVKNDDKVTYGFMDDLCIMSNNNDFGYTIKFSQCGINKILGIYEILLYNNNGNVDILSNTDWIGPIMVESLEEKLDSNFPEQFTGGWHGSHGDTTGENTAQTKCCKIFADGVEIEKNTIGKADRVIVVVTNLISGYNTYNNILEEPVSYCISKNKIDVEVKIKALEEVMVYRYYGLQTQNNKFNNKIEYIFEDGSEVTKDINISNDSGNKEDSPRVKEFRISDTQHPFILCAWLDLKSQLASYYYLGEDNPYAFTEKYGKSYFNLINGMALRMESGQIIEWSGGYIFTVE